MKQAQNCEFVFYNKPGVNPGQRTLRISYNLTCDREWLLPTTTTMGFAGNAIGGLIGGRMSDHFGRRPIYLWSLFLQIVLLAVTVWAPNVYWYMFGIFWATFMQMISYQVGMVMLSELVTKKQTRTIYQCCYGLIFSIGVVLLPVVAFYLPDWRVIMLIACVSRLIAVPYYWLIPESWKWLRAKNKEATGEEMIELKTQDSENTIQATIQKTEEVLNEDKNLQNKKNSNSQAQNEAGFSAIFTHPEARKRLLLICICWMLQTYSYYGMNINATNISSDHIYRNTILSCFVDIPSCFFTMFLIEYLKLGKRGSFKISLVLTFIIMLTGLIIKNLPNIDQKFPIIFEMAMILGKLFLCNITNIIWIYAQDLFPTNVRNTAVGVAAFSSQMGSCIAPYIVEMGRGNPNILYGSCLGISGLVFTIVSFLPDTDDEKLPDTLSEL